MLAIPDGQSNQSLLSFPSLINMANSEHDTLEQFLIEAQAIFQEAELLVNALPNVELFAVERSLQKLAAMLIILHGIDSEAVLEDTLEDLIFNVNKISCTLHGYLESLTSEDSHNERAAPPSKGTRGRPQLEFDLSRAVELHNMGNSWNEVAGVFGVARRTIYYHLTAANRSPLRPEYNIISDNILDEAVTLVCLKHPYSGQNVIQAHLAAAGIRVPVHRVQASLQRVDPIGVLTR
jgi:hypothetical protein